jgi:hypothetical protein
MRAENWRFLLLGFLLASWALRVKEREKSNKAETMNHFIIE